MNKKISIVIPSFNSSATIYKTFESIKKQKYPKRLVEVLVIDGGSSDRTLVISRKYGYKVFNNPKRQQEYAKTIGLEKATGEVVMFLDSDEVLEQENALERSIDALVKNKLAIVLATGYKRPANSSSINDYINFFSDPFAHFMYGTSSDWRTKILSWKNKYGNYIEKENLIIFSFPKNKSLPLVDMAAGTVINKKRILNDLDSKETNSQFFITKLFYLINKVDNRIGILKNSCVYHYSADSYLTFLNKIRWRVRVNIHYKNIPGTGFSNREDYQPFIFRIKKYLFLPYALTLLIPFFESIFFGLKYKKLSLLLHLPLTVYTAFVIIYEYLLLIVGIKPKIHTYGKN